MKQYSFYNVDLLIDGQPVDGFSDSNSIITATRSREAHNKIVDARGKVVVNTIADLTGEFTFNLLQVSDWNAILRKKLEETQAVGLSGNATTFLPMQVMMSDKMGNTKVTGVNAFITQQPALVRGTGINDVRWVIQCERLLFAEGTLPEVAPI